MCAVQISPEWYTSAAKNLAAIEANAADYECPEEGEKAPPTACFKAVREFFKVLRDTDEKLEEPRIFVSNEGHLLLSYGRKDRSIDLRFTPQASFHFRHENNGHQTGASLEKAKELVLEYFRI